MSTKCYEHIYSYGLRQRWYTVESVAKSVLARIPAVIRGEFTKVEPLKTSPAIWRVDDYPRKEATCQLP